MSWFGDTYNSVSDWYDENIGDPVDEWQKSIFGAEQQKQLDQSAVPTTNNQTSVVPVAIKPPATAQTSTWTKVGVVAGVLSLAVGAYVIFKK